MKQERGVALITAIILVALAAVLATAIGFGSGMAARRATTSLAVEQAFLAAQGVEAMAAYVIKQSSTTGANGGVFSLDQPWAQPYGPYEMSDGVTLDLAQLEDEQGKFNLNDLAPDGHSDTPTALANILVFQRLLQKVGLETKWAGMMADWIDTDDTPQNQDGAEDSAYVSQQPPYRTANIHITSISEMLALPGFGRERYDRISPYITALPPGPAQINVCTAPGEVLDALTGLDEYGGPTSNLAAQRKQANGCFPPQNPFQNSIQGTDASAIKGLIGTTTSYFRLRTFITIGTARFTLYSLLYRDGQGHVRPILRTFGTE